VSSAARELLRIIFVLQDDFASPTEQQAFGFAQELARRGHEVMLSIACPPESLEQENLSLPERVTMVRHVLRGPIVSREARDRVRAFAPDVIHSWKPRAPSIAVTRNYRRITGAPCFVHFEDDEWQTWPTVPGIRTKLGWLRRRALASVDPKSWEFSTPGVLRWVRRSAAAVDAIVPTLAREVETRLGRACIVILPTLPQAPIDSDAPSLLPDPGPDRPVHILFTGKVTTSSLPDFRHAIEAIAIVRWRGLDVRLVQAGKVQADVDLLPFVDDAGLDRGALILLGHVALPDLGATLRSATALLQPGPPSRFNRLRLPAKLTLYLRSGVPTITFAGGVGELLVDREEVLMTYTDDPEELADRIVELVADADLRQRLARGGPLAAKRLFDAATNTDALLAYYRSALQSVAPALGSPDRST